MSEKEVYDGGIGGFDPTILFGKGFNLGCADLVVGGPWEQVVGRVTMQLLISAVDQNRDSVFAGVTILLPPVQVTKITESAVFAALSTAALDMGGLPLSDEGRARLRRIVRVAHIPSLDSASLMSAIEGQGSRRIIAVMMASHFQDSTVNIPVAFGATATRLAEDRWVPHVTSLCRQLVSIAQRTDSYALVHVPDGPVTKMANLRLIDSIDDCYVTELVDEERVEHTLATRCEKWIKMAFQGRLEEVVVEVNELDISEGDRLYMLVQVVGRTDKRDEVLSLLRRIQPHLSSFPADVAVHVARLAIRAGDDDLARNLLPHSPDDIDTCMWIEEGLEIATQLRDNSRIANFDARLEAVLPSSERLRENRDRRLMMNSQSGRASDEPCFTNAGYTIRHLKLQELLLETKPDYSEVIEEASAWGEEWGQLATVCCAGHARSEGLFYEAACMTRAITASDLYGRQAAQVLLYSIRSMMLMELIPREYRDIYRELFQSVLEFLALHPADGAIRTSLTSLLSVETCGDMGVPLVALTMLDLAGGKIAMSPSEEVQDQVRTELQSADVMASICAALRWMGELGAGEFGVAEIPRELIVAPPDDVVQVIGILAQEASGQLEEDADLIFMEKLVFIACAICQHATKNRDDDLRLMRLLASNHAAAGQLQHARDIAEQILLMGQSSKIRQRLAWSAFGDVYHHCRNYATALVGMGCALAIDVPVNRADLWHEVYTIHRILRDLGLWDLCQKFIPAMRRLLADLGFDPASDSRVVAADLCVQLMRSHETSLSEQKDLLTKISSACERALGDRSALLPLAALLGQATSKFEAAGGEICSDSRAILDLALRQVGGKAAGAIRTITAERPSADDVLALFNEVQRATFAADVARDYAHVNLVARHLLKRGAQGTSVAVDAAFATELLADQTIKLPSNMPLMTTSWAAEYAFELNDAGCEVVFMVLDERGELSVTHAADHKIHAIEQPLYEQTFKRRFDAWLADYPSCYGTIDPSEGNNIFYLSMGQLDVRLPSADRLVIVAEPVLQQLTVNLVVKEPEGDDLSDLLGAHSSIGTVPSLTWLASVRRSKLQRKVGYKAWISAQLDQGFENHDVLNRCSSMEAQTHGSAKTLDVALRRLNGSFESFGFVVDTGQELPRDMKDAGIAVVTAHGGLCSDGRFLHSIRDDEGLVEAPSALAGALAGTELVILFVCSGGRIDKSPWDNSTTSLSKQLLNRGSQAVVASPWPLNVLVTYNWLDPFMSAWEDGATVLDATKRANEVVARRFGAVPQYSLAMRVYGNILLTKPSINGSANESVASK